MKNSNKNSKIELTNLLKKNGYSNRAIAVLYKWYDSTEHKGVASF